MSERLESSKWKMQLHRSISPFTTALLVCCVVATGILSTDALPLSKKIPSSSQPLITTPTSHSDIGLRSETDADPQKSNLVSLSRTNVPQKDSDTILFQRKKHVKRKRKEFGIDKFISRRHISPPINRGRTLKSQPRQAIKSSLKKLWEQLDQRTNNASSYITEPSKVNRTDIGENIEKEDFPLLANIDYSNYYYDDLGLETKEVLPNKIETTTTAIIEGERTSLSPNANRQARKLQSRKISDQTIHADRNKFRNGNSRIEVNEKKSMNILKEFPIFRSNKGNGGSKLSLHERLKKIQNADNKPDAKTSTTAPKSPIKSSPLTSAPKAVSLPSEIPPKGSAIDPIDAATETIKTNVTFSTSQSHRSNDGVADPYPDILSLALLDEQLGKAPFGNSPFGFAPFGELPQGANPFGRAPEGLSPMGNQSLSLVINQTSEVTGEQGNGEGRYHVQVTAPNGSINGNYVVVDPVTGDLNGVQYEVAENVDPNIVQNALLNFLSLSPRGPPNFSEATTAPNLEERSNGNLDQGELASRNKTQSDANSSTS